MSSLPCVPAPSIVEAIASMHNTTLHHGGLQHWSMLHATSPAMESIDSAAHGVPHPYRRSHHCHTLQAPTLHHEGHRSHTLHTAPPPRVLLDPPFKDLNTTPMVVDVSPNDSKDAARAILELLTPGDKRSRKGNVTPLPSLSPCTIAP
jgi:hypothetical protein